MAAPTTSLAPQAQSTYEQPFYDAAAIVVATPYPAAKAIYVGVGGTVTVTMVTGNSVSFVGVVAGTTLPIATTNVSSVVTAASLVALY